MPDPESIATIPFPTPTEVLVCAFCKKELIVKGKLFHLNALTAEGVVIFVCDAHIEDGDRLAQHANLVATTHFQRNN